jgi:ketosteroid isomerase-like protein
MSASRPGRAAAGAVALLVALLPSLVQAQASAAAPSAAPLPPVVHSAAECAVWRRELSFAKSVEAHDAKAFAAHLHPGAVFNAGSRSPLRGGDTVAQAWAGIVEGKEFILRWRPGVVAIGGDPNIALSRGPSFSETPGADPKERYKVGFFQSVWVRDAASGEWRVLFDRADGPPRIVASADEGRAHLAAQSSDECVASK